MTKIIKLRKFAKLIKISVTKYQVTHKRSLKRVAKISHIILRVCDPASRENAVAKSFKSETYALHWQIKKRELQNRVSQRLQVFQKVSKGFQRPGFFQTKKIDQWCSMYCHS